MSQQMPPEQPGQMPVSSQAPQQYAQQPAPLQTPAPEKKRSWFARHKVLTGLGGAVVLIIIISIAASGGNGGSDEADAAAKTKTKTETETAETATQDSKKVAEEPKKEEGKPGLGTPVKSGDFEFTALGVEEVGTTVGNSISSATAQGRYVRVNVRVANIGDSSNMFLTNGITVIDQQGRSFSTDTSAMLYSISNSDILSADTINPGNAIEGGVIFDMPADAVPTTLKVSGSGFSSGSQEITLVG